MIKRMIKLELTESEECIIREAMDERVAALQRNLDPEWRQGIRKWSKTTDKDEEFMQRYFRETLAVTQDILAKLAKGWAEYKNGN